MQRTTEAHLQAVCDRINRVTGNALTPYTETVHPDGKKTYAANLGNYHLSHAYSGVSLVRMQNQGGGISNVFGCGHITKRDLADRMHAFLAGFDAASSK